MDDVNRLIGEMMTGVATRYETGAQSSGAAVLLDASSNTRASELAAAASPRLRCVAVDSGPSLLLRPDACIAWAGDGDGIEGLAEALRRWFNPALPSA